MSTKEIRSRLADAHAVHGAPAKVKFVRSGWLAGTWLYKKFRPCYGYRSQPWLIAGQTEEVVRWLS